MADIKKRIEENKAKLERAKIVASPPGVPPPVVPVLEPGKIGFVENAERWNSRASMVGWWSLLLVELVAGKGGSSRSWVSPSVRASTSPSERRDRAREGASPLEGA